jgi:hypothetical protein
MKNYLTRAVKGIAQMKTDAIMEKYARKEESSMEDIINNLIYDSIKIKDLPEDDKLASLAMSAYLIGIMQGLALVRESGVVSEDALVKIISSLYPEIPEDS